MLFRSAFDDELVRPDLAQRIEVAPADRIGAQTRAAHRALGHLGFRGRRIVRVHRHAGGHEVSQQHAEEPARMIEDVARGAVRDTEWQLEAVVRVVF